MLNRNILNTAIIIESFGVFGVFKHQNKKMDTFIINETSDKLAEDLRISQENLLTALKSLNKSAKELSATCDKFNKG